MRSSYFEDSNLQIYTIMKNITQETGRILEILLNFLLTASQMLIHPNMEIHKTFKGGFLILQMSQLSKRASSVSCIWPY